VSRRSISFGIYAINFLALRSEHTSHLFHFSASAFCFVCRLIIQGVPHLQHSIQTPVWCDSILWDCRVSDMFRIVTSSCVPKCCCQSLLRYALFNASRRVANDFDAK
jgi:hypothetical protein